MGERCACCNQTSFREGMSHRATWPKKPAETSRSPCGENSAKNQDGALPLKMSSFFLVAISHSSMPPPEHTGKVLLSGEKLIRPSGSTGSVNDSQFAVFQRRIFRRCNEAANH